jgi:putative ABC transport system permease protein
MSSLLQDLRYAVRGLSRSPGFTVVTVLTLALGIGANTAIFSYVDATWLRPLPARDPGRLMRIFTSEHDATGEHARGPSSYIDYMDVRSQATAFSDVLAFEGRGALLYGPETVTELRVEVVSPNYFTALGIQPVLGRVFTDAEAAALAEHPGVVISYELWRQQFGGDPATVGRQVRLTNAHVTLLGVAPRGFRGIDLHTSVDVWVPPPVWSLMGGGSGLAPEFTMRGNRRRDILARLKPGISLEQAQAELDTIGARLARQYPDTNKESRFTAAREIDTRGEDVARQGRILLLIALAIALIAAANLANLQLGRAETRRRETATRLALGGGRFRLLRERMTESLLVSVIGTACALLAAKWVITVLPTLSASGLISEGGYDFRLDARALLFTTAIAAGTTILLGLAPVFQGFDADVGEMLRGGTTVGGTRRGARVRDALVVGQVAASLVLLVAAGLLVKTFANLEAVRPGFNPRQNVLMLYVVPELARRSDAQLHAYYNEVQERLGALPGVQQASLVQRVPFSPFLSGAEREIVVPGVEPPPGRTGFRINFDVVARGYFSLMGTRLLQGRVFSSVDGPQTTRVVIVNDTMARRFWPEGAIGRHLRIGNTDYEIVGTVEDTKWESVTETPRSLLYFPMTQQESDSVTILLRTAGDPAALVKAARAELHRIDPNVPLLSATTLREHMDYTLKDEHNRARLVSAFAGLGLSIAAVGLYGVLAFVVARRTREIGVRIAIGAAPATIFRLVLDYAVRRVAAGLAVGIVIALALRKVIAGLLYGVTAGDPVTFVGVVLLLVVVGLVAALVPARRATKVDPIVALRTE